MKRRVDKKLLLYIQDQINNDVDRGSITQKLINVGWQKEVIDGGFSAYQAGERVRLSKMVETMKVIGKSIAILTLISLGIFNVLLVMERMKHDSGSNNAAVKQTLSSIRSQAEIVYNHQGEKNNFNAVCGANDVSQDSSMIRLIEAADANNGEGKVVCGAPLEGMALSYAVSAELLGEYQDFWCVDSSGFAGEISRQINLNETKCPQDLDK